MMSEKENAGNLGSPLRQQWLSELDGRFIHTIYGGKARVYDSATGDFYDPTQWLKMDTRRKVTIESGIPQNRCRSAGTGWILGNTCPRRRRAWCFGPVWIRVSCRST